MLDRLILLNSTAYADSFYRDIDMIDTLEINDFLLPGTLNGEYRFSDFFQKFREAKYIYKYTEDESFIYALNRIMKRASQPVFEGETAISSLKISIFEVEKHLAPVYLQHFEELKQKTKA